ncbi:hypothetical protein JCM1841_004223 [Sporobolomyces salmonicolor]
MANASFDVIFDKSRRFPAVWIVSKAAIDALVGLISAPYSAESHAAVPDSVRAFGEAAGLRSRSLERFVAFWTRELDLLPRSSASPITPNAAAAAGLHPFIVATLRGPEYRDAAQSMWFNSKGGSRLLPPAAEDTDVETDGEGGTGADSATERGSEAGTQGAGTPTPGPDEDGDAATGPPRAAVPPPQRVDPDRQGDAGPSLRQLLLARPGGTLRAGDLAGAAAAANPGIAAASGARARAADFLDNPQSELFGGDAPDEIADGPDLDPLALRQVPDPGAMAFYLLEVQAALNGLPKPVSQEELPKWVRDYRAAVEARTLVFHRKTSRDRQALLDAWRIIAGAMAISFDTVQTVALGEHLSLVALRDSRPGKAAELSEEQAIVYGLKTNAGGKKAPPLDPFEWEKQFTRWTQLVVLVNAGNGFLDELKREHSKYQEHILLHLHRATSAPDPADARRRLLDYDEQVRAEIASNDKHAYVKHFGNASPNDQLFHRIVARSLDPGPAPRSPPVAARFLAAREPDEVPYCYRYNHNVEHKAGKCIFRHACDRSVGAAIVASAREVRMEGTTGGPWAPDGKVLGGDLVVSGEAIDDLAPPNPLPGLTSSPRLLRAFHWPPSNALPTASSLDASLTAPPLPQPPARALLDERAMSLIRRRPALFSSYSPLRHHRLAVGLASHPNRRWAESLVNAVKDGFWPAHSGDEPAVPSPALDDRLFPSRREDQLVQVAAAEKARAGGLISDAFDELEPGMFVSPQFAVRREGSEPRIVDDHSASGLNEGISGVPATYDRIDQLVRLLRYAGIVEDELPDHAVLWKLDVSAAFKLILMHPLWQARQAILVAYRDSAGRLRPRFHLQWRAAFGSRASPYLWTSLMAGVMWIVRDRHAAFVPFPLFYMDDAFNADLSGETRVVVHDGEARRVPAGQAATIEVWDEIGLAWKWAKAEHGRALTITGIVVDIDDASLYLDRAAVERFAVAVSSFLSSPDRQQPLRRWRQIGGWGNWALTVRPWAKALLAPVFAKMGRSPSPYTRLFLNEEVRHGLLSLVAELRSDDPLSMRDPALTEWSEADAHVVVYCDACLRTTKGDGSGLGFWYDDPRGRRLRFAARPAGRYPNIPFAESLSVACAILHLLDNHPGRCILVKTDSSPAAYAFDSGSSRLPSVAALVRAVYERLRTRQVDLRIRHIRGVQNVTADRLSRDPIETLVADFGGAFRPFDSGRLVRFAPSSAPSARASPWPPLSHALTLRKQLWVSSIAASTSTAYDRAFRLWGSFVLAYTLPEFPTAHSLSLFVAVRSPRVVPSTIAGELSGLAFFFKAVDAERWERARASIEVLRALAGNAKANPHQPKKALPLAVDDLLRAVHLALALDSYDGLLWAAMAAVGFLSCARAQELTEYDNPHYRDVSKRIVRASLRLSPEGFSVDLPYHKADALYTGTKLWYSTADAGDLHLVVATFINLRDRIHGRAGPLWLQLDANPPTRQWFVERLKARAGPQYTGHSFRAGGASWYTVRGAPDEAIKKIGRWKSSSWEDYVRLQPEIAIAQRERDVLRLPPPPPPSLDAAALYAIGT